MPILFFVNCERSVLFSVKRDLDPPPPLPPSLIYVVSSKQSSALAMRFTDEFK